MGCVEVDYLSSMLLPIGYISVLTPDLVSYLRTSNLTCRKRQFQGHVTMVKHLKTKRQSLYDDWRYCWLGLLTCKNRLPYNLYCVGVDVKHCSLTHSRLEICLEMFFKVLKEVAERTASGRLFHTRDAATPNARSPTVRHRVRGTISL